MKGSVLLTLVLTFAAVLLRFYKLGEWSFGLDEVPSLLETRSLFDPSLASESSQTFRLPRLAPLGYLLNAITYPVMGTDEFGSRVGPALMGSATVGVVFYLGEILFGRKAALVIALLVLLSPAHVFQSQLNRFYSATAFFTALGLLSGALAARTATFGWTALACVSAALATLSHTVGAALFPMLCVGIVGTRYAEYRTLPRAVTLTLGISALVFALGFLVHTLPHIRGWNQGATWGYSVGRSVLASANLLGWPLSLFAGLGAVLMAEAKSKERWYWFSALALWGSVTLVLPVLSAYHPWYAFPFAMSGLVCAGVAVSAVHERLQVKHPVAGALFIGVALSVSLPGLVSHFVDGSRVDMRAAAGFVNSHWDAQDRAVVDRASTFQHYAPGREPVFGLPPGDAGVRLMMEQAAHAGRLWIVIGSTRSGLSESVQRWLFDNASHRLRISKTRFDYFQNAIDVFLVDDASSTDRRAPDGPR